MMPGKVVRVIVAMGDMVEAGQGLIVVEAMKMQNEMVSPRAGRVRGGENQGRCDGFRRRSVDGHRIAEMPNPHCPICDGTGFKIIERGGLSGLRPRLHRIEPQR